MNPNTRACVAAAAGRLISGSASTSVYDCSGSKHIIINGNVSEGNVQLYDNDRQCHFSGSGSGGDYDLYDYDAQAHVSLQITGISSGAMIMQPNAISGVQSTAI
jgi:hypothetical protein